MSIEALKRIVAAVEAIPEDAEGWMPDALTDALIDARQAIAVYESAPPECQTEAEKTAFAFGWWKAMEAQQAEKQEPVAWQVHPFDYGIGHEGVYARTDRLEQVEAWKRKGWNVQSLYTRPQPKREWVGLTDEEIYTEARSHEKWAKDGSEWFSRGSFARAIEAKLKEKNT
jgi:hypothetical protein